MPVTTIMIRPRKTITPVIIRFPQDAATMKWVIRFVNTAKTTRLSRNPVLMAVYAEMANVDVDHPTAAIKIRQVPANMFVKAIPPTMICR